MDAITSTAGEAGPTDGAGPAPSTRQAIGLQRERLGAVLLVVVGAILLLIGWIGVANAVHPAQQLPYLISGGLGGVGLLGIGAALWLSADLADEWTKLDLIESALTRIAEAGAPAEIPAEIPAEAPAEVAANAAAAVAPARRSARVRQLAVGGPTS